MKKIKSLLTFFVGIVIILLFVASFTPVGKNLIQFYIQKKVNYYFPSLRIKNFEIKYDDFSMLLIDEDAFYKVYGQLYPLDAILEGEMKKLVIGNKTIKEKVYLTGKIKYDNNYFIKANTFFNKYNGNLEVNLTNKKIVYFETNNIDLNYFLTKIGKNIKNLDGQLSLYFLYENKQYKGKAIFKGKYFKKDLISDFDFSFKDFDNLKLKGNVKSSILQGDFSSIILKNNITYHANFSKFDLSILDLIYPFKEIVSLSLIRDNLGIIKFKSDDFSGFKNKKINVTFNMSIDKFFRYLRLFNPFKKGDVLGELIIADRGNFSFIIKDAKVKDFILKNLKINNNSFNKIFVKGYFNRKKVFFSLFTKNKIFNISIKGEIKIKNLRPTFILTITLPKEKRYYKFIGSKLIFIKKESLKKNNNKILVF
jgi:hypothetical protein